VRFLPTQLDGVVIVEPQIFRDSRGFFLEVHHAAKFARGGIDESFVQDNHSRSTYGTLRGLHAQLLRPQGKLVRAIRGRIFDVAVDIRPSSATFGRWVGVELNDEDFRQLWVPPGFAHGFCALSPIAEVGYKCTALYDAEDEIGIAWDDPDLAITWPVDEPLLSDKDRNLPRLAEIVASLREAEASDPA
jgi:dTDP-4-dehydrorhamnose 3,5-epimerase